MWSCVEQFKGWIIGHFYVPGSMLEAPVHSNDWTCLKPVWFSMVLNHFAYKHFLIRFAESNGSETSSWFLVFDVTPICNV